MDEGLDRPSDEFCFLFLYYYLIITMVENGELHTLVRKSKYHYRLTHVLWKWSGESFVREDPLLTERFIVKNFLNSSPSLNNYFILLFSSDSPQNIHYFKSRRSPNRVPNLRALNCNISNSHLPFKLHSFRLIKIFLNVKKLLAIRNPLLFFRRSCDRRIQNNYLEFTLAETSAHLITILLPKKMNWWV